jgi:glycosyltransferase involved in cell wall biosynthesis
MNTEFANRVNILIFWFAGEQSWDQGRTYQKVAEHLSALPAVRRVVVTFPPTKHDGSYNKPLTIRRITDKLTLLTETLKIIPDKGPAYHLRKWANNLSSHHALTTYLRLIGFSRDNTLLWFFPPHPYLNTLIERVPHALLVGHIVDNFTHHSDPWLNRYAHQQYPFLQAKADVIVAGSQFNYEIFRQNRTATYLFENAVDKGFLSKPSATPVTREGPPHLGYVGTLSERTDFELLEHLSRTRPDWHLSIAGKSECSLDDFSWLKLPNVEYLGLIPYTKLPNFLRTLDVCLIPHRNTEYSQSMSPLKLFQYLASGRPIVSTEVAGLEKAKEHVLLANTKEDFVTSIEHALHQDTLEMSAGRIELAQSETWESRVSDMFQAVISHMPKD